MIYDAYGRRVGFIEAIPIDLKGCKPNAICLYCKERMSYLGNHAYKCINKACLATVCEMVIAEKYAAIGLGW